MNVFLTLLGLSAASAFTTPTSPWSSTWLREAEKKHARVALLAVPTLVAVGAATGDDPVGWLNQQPAATQLLFYATAGVLESYNLRRFDAGFTLKPSETPGKLLPVSTVPEWDVAEDVAGRTAMIAAAGFFAHTLLA